jgi:hypothetical protein
VLQSGAITPEMQWLLYSENPVAPLRRKSTGAFMLKTKWLLYAENTQKKRRLWLQIYGISRSGISFMYLSDASPNKSSKGDGTA